MTTGPLGLIAVDLRSAMRQPGCPICRIRDEAEHRYLYFLLWENVNDGATRVQIIRSLGFCPRHTWQMGRMETHHFGDAFGNSIIYENLVEVVRNRLARYVRRAQSDERSRWRLWLDRVLQRPRRAPFPDELQPEATCRVCQTGDQTETSHLHWLLQGLSDPTSEFREWYLGSERLCFWHLRLALEQADSQTEAGAMFLAQDAIEYLGRLRADLREFGGKHAWERRFETMTDAEQNSWLKAFIFFGGNERSDGIAVDSARSDRLSPDIQTIASDASDVLVGFPGHLPDGLADELRALVSPAVRLDFQCPPRTAPKVILALLTKGHHVFEGEVPPEVLVFFDRRYGYRLPDWSPLPDPFALACRLAWSRTAAFVQVQGTVAEVTARPEVDFALVRLAENPHLRLSVPRRLGVPIPGATVSLLGRHDFRFGMDVPLLEGVAIFDEHPVRE